MIDMVAFTPWSALIGGVLIGLSAAVLMLGSGRVAGVSGIFGRLPEMGSDLVWRVVFLAGLVAGAWLTAQMGWIDGQVRPGFTGPYAWVGLVVAGLAVGVGTRFGGGCTSGHGICGMSRFSVRSIVAVLVFMVVGFVTASLMGVFVR